MRSTVVDSAKDRSSVDQKLKAKLQGMVYNPGSLEEQAPKGGMQGEGAQEEDDAKDNFEGVLAPITTTTAAPTPTRNRTFSLASVAFNSAECSFGSSISNGSPTSLQRNSARRMSLPRRHGHRKPKEMTWLRDTLSLGSSTHSDLMIRMESEDEAASGSETEFVGGSDAGSGRLVLELGAASSSGDSYKNPRHVSLHVRAKAAPAFLACLQEDIDFDPDLPVAPPHSLTPPELPSHELPQPAPAVGTDSKVYSVVEDEELDTLPIDREKSGEEGNGDDVEQHEAPRQWIRTTRQSFSLPPPRDSAKSSSGRSPATTCSVESNTGRSSGDRWGGDDNNEASGPREQRIRLLKDARDVVVPFARSRTAPVETAEMTELRRPETSGEWAPNPIPSSPRETSGGRQPVPVHVGESSVIATAGERTTKRPVVECPDDLYCGRGQESPRTPGDLSPVPRRPSRPRGSPISFNDTFGQQFCSGRDWSPPPRPYERFIRPSSPPPRPCNRIIPPLSPLGAARSAPYHQPSRRRDDSRERPSPRWIPITDRSPPRWGQPGDRPPPRWNPVPRRDPCLDQPTYKPDPRDRSRYGRRSHDDSILRPSLRESSPRLPRQEFAGDECDYYGAPRRRRSDLRSRPATRHDDCRHSQQAPNRSRSNSSGHWGVCVRMRHADWSPPRGMVYDVDRPPYYREEDPCFADGNDHNKGGSPGDCPPRDRSMFNPASGGYCGPPTSQDAYGDRSRYSTSRGAVPNEDLCRRSSPPPLPPMQEQNQEDDTRYRRAAPLRPTNGNNDVDINTQRYCDQDLLDEKLQQNGGSLNGVAPVGDQSKPILVEISPGVCVALRRTQETMTAISKDFYQGTSCFACSMDIFCIADVCYVICPSCKVVSPVSGEYFEGRLLTRHGIGLGFTLVTLFKLQNEVLQDRSKCEKEPKP